MKKIAIVNKKGGVGKTTTVMTDDIIYIIKIWQFSKIMKFINLSLLSNNITNLVFMHIIKIYDVVGWHPTTLPNPLFMLLN